MNETTTAPAMSHKKFSMGDKVIITGGIYCKPTPPYSRGIVCNAKIAECHPPYYLNCICIRTENPPNGGKWLGGNVHWLPVDFLDKDPSSGAIDVS